VKLLDFWSSAPLVHAAMPKAAQSLTVGVRGVKALETCPDGILVTLKPEEGVAALNEEGPVRDSVNEDGELTLLLVGVRGVGVPKPGEVYSVEIVEGS